MPDPTEHGARVASAPLGDVIPPAPEGSSLLFENEPGVEAEAFLYEVAHEQLAQDRDVVAVLLNRSPSTVTSEMAGLGLPADDGAGELSFVDAFSAMLGVEEDAAYRVDDVENAKAFVDVIETVADDNPGAALVVDSLSAWFDRVGPRQAESLFPKLAGLFDRFGLTTALYTSWLEEEQVEGLRDAFDALVHVGGLQDRVIFGQYFTVDRVDWAPEAPSPRRHIFETDRPGGVRVYMPKIVVTGPYNSGKSTFVKSVSDESVSVDRLGTTVALDHGHVEQEGISADVFGTPGQVRFDPILETVAGQALGVIVLVDATNPSTFDRARELLEKTWSEGLPGVIAANKQDLPNALSGEEVQAQIDPDGRASVVECVGAERDSARAVLDLVTRQILHDEVPA